MGWIACCPAFCRAGRRLTRRAVGDVGHHARLLAAPGDVQHAIAVLGRDDLAESSSRLSRIISATLRSWKSSMFGHHAGRQRDIARHAVPQKMKLVALVPDVIAGGSDGVGLARLVIAGAAGHQRSAHIGAVLELADALVEGDGVAVEIQRRQQICLCVGDCGNAQSGTSMPGGAGAARSSIAPKPVTPTMRHQAARTTRRIKPLRMRACASVGVRRDVQTGPSANRQKIRTRSPCGCFRPNASGRNFH